MSDQEQIKDAETALEEAAVFPDVIAIIDGTEADEPARGSLNGSSFEYARNVEHTMPDPHFNIIENAGYPIRNVGGQPVPSPEPADAALPAADADDGAAQSEDSTSDQGDGGAPVEGGTGSTVNQIDTSVLDGTAEEVIAKLPEFSGDYLKALLAAETAGKTRKTVIAALEAAIAGAVE